REPFVVYDPDDAPKLAIGSGTSYASPASLRLAVGLRAHFGMRLGPLALKALLVHSAEAAGHDRDEVGWGSIPNELDSFVVCEDGMVRVVYQGELSPSQYLRALVPLPDAALSGFVRIRVTLCYASHTDPQDPGNYTRSGLDVVFRPDARR